MPTKSRNRRSPKKLARRMKTTRHLLRRKGSGKKGSARARNPKKTFRLYKTTYAKDHYLGEWLLNDSKINGNKTKLELFRSQKQSKIHEEVVDVFRSKSESNHELVLQELFPGFKIIHDTLDMYLPLSNI